MLLKKAGNQVDTRLPLVSTVKTLANPCPPPCPFFLYPPSRSTSLLMPEACFHVVPRTRAPPDHDADGHIFPALRLDTSHTPECGGYRRVLHPCQGHRRWAGGRSTRRSPCSQHRKAVCWVPLPATSKFSLSFPTSSCKQRRQDGPHTSVPCFKVSSFQSRVLWAKVTPTGES